MSIAVRAWPRLCVCLPACLVPDGSHGNRIDPKPSAPGGEAAADNAHVEMIDWRRLVRCHAGEVTGSGHVFSYFYPSTSRKAAASASVCSGLPTETRMQFSRPRLA